MYIFQPVTIAISGVYGPKKKHKKTQNQCHPTKRGKSCTLTQVATDGKKFSLYLDQISRISLKPQKLARENLNDNSFLRGLFSGVFSLALALNRKGSEWCRDFFLKKTIRCVWRSLCDLCMEKDVSFWLFSQGNFLFPKQFQVIIGKKLFLKIDFFQWKKLFPFENLRIHHSKATPHKLGSPCLTIKIASWMACLPLGYFCGDDFAWSQDYIMFVTFSKDRLLANFSEITDRIRLLPLHRHVIENKTWIWYAAIGWCLIITISRYDKKLGYHMIFNQLMPSHVALKPTSSENVKDGWDQDQTFHLSSGRLDSWMIWKICGGPPLDPNKHGALGGYEAHHSSQDKALLGLILSSSLEKVKTICIVQSCPKNHGKMPYCWWFRNPARKPPAMYKKSLVNNGINCLSLNWFRISSINSFTFQKDSIQILHRFSVEILPCSCCRGPCLKSPGSMNRS